MSPYYDFYSMVQEQQETNDKLDDIITELNTLEQVVYSGDTIINNNIQTVNDNMLAGFILLFVVLCAICFFK